MLLFHICYANGGFYLWSEHSYTSDSLTKVGRAHPFASSKEELCGLLEKLGLKQKETAPLFATATVKLPASNGIPMPASRIIGDFDTEAVSLEEFEVPVVALSRGNIYHLKDSLNKKGGRLAVTGIMPGNDAMFFVEAFKYATLLVMRGCFIPYMNKTEQGCISCWEPLYLPKYHSEYAAFLKDMPPSLRYFSVGGHSAPDNIEKLGTEILEYFVDGIVRTSQIKTGKGKIVNIDNTHEMWLRSLTWPHSSLSNWTNELRSVYPQITSWAEETKASSGKPWQLLLRIEAPERMDDDTRWLMTWHLQALRDESIVIPAEKVWAPTDAERKLFEFVGENPRKFLLQTLGTISEYIPPVEDSLYKANPVSCEFSAGQLYDFMTEARPRLYADGVRIQYPAAWGRAEDRLRFAVSGTLSDGSSFSPDSAFSLSDLLDVDWNVTLGGEQLTEQEIEMLKTLKTPFVQLHGKTVFINQDELLSIIQKIDELPKKINRRSALLSSLTGNFEGQRISSMRDSGWLDDAVAVLTGKKKLPTLKTPDNFNGTLRPYQLRGLSWLDWITKLGLGGCLADDMGLGKTIETLALLQQQKNEGKTGPVLLVCPTTVAENWRTEAERFVPQLKTYVHYGIDRLRGEKFANSIKDVDIVITSYSLLSRDYDTITGINWRGAILDEAQNIKNPVTRQSRTAHSINADWHLALTGTPVENHVGDLWSILEFCVPGLLPNKTAFARDFLRPIQAGNSAQLDKLTLMTGPFILRRVKTDKEIIADLPEKIETHEFCPLGHEQASLYAAVVGRLDADIVGSVGIQRKGLVLSTITNLKEICDHPALFKKDNLGIAGRSGKLVRLSELCEVMLAAGDRALIFTQYASMGVIIKNYLQETFGDEVLFLHGGLPKAKRDELISRFEQPDGPQLFVLSLKAGGTGLNLINANHVILFDRWWNPAVEQQAVDRAYRIGQSRNVQVHYFCCKGTLEEKIERFINSKRHVANAVVREGENWLTELSDEELHDLFVLNIVEEEND